MSVLKSLEMRNLRAAGWSKQKTHHGAAMATHARALWDLNAVLSVVEGCCWGEFALDDLVRRSAGGLSWRTPTLRRVLPAPALAGGGSDLEMLAGLAALAQGQVSRLERRLASAERHVLRALQAAGQIPGPGSQLDLDYRATFRCGTGHETVQPIRVASESRFGGLVIICPVCANFSRLVPRSAR